MKVAILSNVISSGQISFISHMVQMKDKQDKRRGVVKSRLYIPHGSDESPDVVIKIDPIRIDLYIPHGSDESHLANLQ